MNQQTTREDLIASIFFYTTAFFGFFLLIMVAVGDEAQPKYEYELEKLWEREIQQIGEQDVLNINTEDDKTHYSFLIKDEKGEFDTLSLNTKFVKVVYSEDKDNPKLEKYQRTYQSWDKLRMLFANKDSKYEYKIYVNGSESEEKQ